MAGYVYARAYAELNEGLRTSSDQRSRGEVPAGERYSLLANRRHRMNAGSPPLVTRATDTARPWCFNDDAQSGNGPASNNYSSAPHGEPDGVPIR